jgi:hypothetical protein
MNLPPLKSKSKETQFLPHPEHISKWRVNEFWSCIMCNLGGNWMQMIINEVLAAFESKRDSDTLLAPFQK